MSYDAEILADLPLLYWPLEDLSGAVATDSSGHNRHGVLADIGFFDLGRPGPIETDAATHGTGFQSTLTEQSHALLLTHPALDIANDISIEAWARLPSGGTGNTIAGLTTNGVTDGQALVWSHSGGVQIGATKYSTSWAGGTPAFDTYYHLVVTRTGSLLRLYVNGVLAGQRNDLPTGAMVTGKDFVVSARLTTNNDHFAGDVSHVALYDHVLSAARVLVHYEAAINATLLNGRSNVVPTAILYSDFPAAPISFPFRHNWSEPLIERVSFKTAISQARLGGEEANSARSKPRRELEFFQMLRNNIERRKLRAQLWAHRDKVWLVPVRADQEQLVAPLASGVSTIPVTTQYMDYEVGLFIGLRQLSDAGEIVHWEELEVLAVNPSSIDTTAPTVHDYAAFLSFVYPVRRAYLDVSESTGHTDAVEELTITARLLAEEEAAVPNRIVPWVPTKKYRDYEVFDPTVWQGNNWDEPREYTLDRELQDIDMEAGVFSVESDAPANQEAFGYRMLLEGRAPIAEFLGWFYERAGAARYLWVASMQSDFEIVSAVGIDLTVSGTDYSDNFALAEPRRDLAFVYHDGSMALRRVVAFSGTINETLVLDSGIPTLTNLRSVSLLKFCRVDADTLEIAWVTDNKVQLAWRFRELQESPAGTGASSASPSASRSVSVSPSASVSPSGSASPSASASLSVSPSASSSPSASQSPSSSTSPSISPSASRSPSSSVSPSGSASPSA